MPQFTFELEQEVTYKELVDVTVEAVDKADAIQKIYTDSDVKRYLVTSREIIAENLETISEKS